MAWTRIDDKFLNNIKIQKAGALGMALYLSGLIHCNTNLTDGFIDKEIIPVLCGLSFQTSRNRTPDKLVELKLWHEVKDGYQVNDFLDFNKSKKETEQLNKQRATNGAKGGRLTKQTETETLSKQVSKQVSKQPPIIPNPLSLIPEQIKTDEEGDSARGKIFTTYENEIGPLTPFIADSIKDVLAEYSDTWVLEAIHEAAIHSVKSFKYIDSILKGWKQYGFKVDTRQKQTKAQYAPKSVNQGLEAVKAMAAEEGITLDGIFEDFGK